MKHLVTAGSNWKKLMQVFYVPLKVMVECEEGKFLYAV